MNINDLSTNKDLHHVIGNMENIGYNDAGKVDMAKTSYVLGQNPWPDMQVLPDELRNTLK